MKQEDIVFFHLQKNRTITSMQAFKQYRITRLASCIHRLREQGHPISTETIYEKNGINYARYHLHRPK